jgi:hypothetical protein
MDDDVTKLFLACFTFTDQNDEVAEGDVKTPEGDFQILVRAKDVADALARLKARLDEIARTTEELGPIQVWLDSLLEASPSDVVRGAFVNYVRYTEETRFIDAFPTQGSGGSTLYQPDVEGDDCGDAEPSPIPSDVFWSGVAAYDAKWKLYWCTTEDHDEDWFVVARNADEAEQFHVEEEGYEEDGAAAELVCVLPASLQKQEDIRGWPSEETLISCGAEFVPYVPQDGADQLREHMGQGGRAVRMHGRLFVEGDIVANTVSRFEKPS